MKINYSNVAQMMKAASGYKDTPKVERSVYDALVKVEDAPVVFLNNDRTKPQLSPTAYRQAQKDAKEGNAKAEQVLRIAKAIRGNPTKGSTVQKATAVKATPTSSSSNKHVMLKKSEIIRCNDYNGKKLQAWLLANKDIIKEVLHGGGFPFCFIRSTNARELNRRVHAADNQERTSLLCDAVIGSDENGVPFATNLHRGLTVTKALKAFNKDVNDEVKVPNTLMLWWD